MSKPAKPAAAKAAKPKSKPPEAAATAPAPGKRPPRPPREIGIRMYRLGVGDCFLVDLPAGAGGRFRMLIDCGIHTAETDGPNRIRKVAENILLEAGDELDVVVGTHEHWDHLSGFHHAKAIFAGGKAHQIWCAWTEDMTDADARGLLKNREQAVTALWGAARQMHLAEEGSAEGLSGLFGFFGDSPGVGVLAKSAAESLRALAPTNIAYRNPGEPPFDSVSDDWRIFVLGPPRNKDMLKHHAPRAGSGEAYPLAAAEAAAADLATAISEDDDPPFDRRYQLPLRGTRAVPFFRDRYWADRAADVAPQTAEDGENDALDWRRIGEAWLGGAEALALQLDKITNNTSLVLALEIGPKTASDNPVILFAADAQVGNWLSWEGVSWPDYHGRAVSGPDLLRRTVIYKVGHHASHNATLMTGGLETMTRLRLALAPTNAVMAEKVKWGTLPWPSLLTRLRDLTGDRLLRSDLGDSGKATAATDIVVDVAADWFDITVPLDLKLVP